MTHFWLRFGRTETGKLCAVAMTTMTVACGGPTPGPDGSGGAADGSGGVSGTGATASGGSADQSGGSSSGGAGSGSGGAASGGAGGGGNDDDSIGSVQAVRTLAFGDSGGNATARFDYVEQAAWDARALAEQTCTLEEFGACSITTCELATDPPLDAPPSSVRLEAGTITLVPDRDEFTASGAPTGENNEYTFTISGSMLGEEILTVTATGGAISAFQGMVQVPLAPLLLSHDASSQRQGAVVPIAVSRTADLALTWDARGTAQKLITLMRYPEGSSLVRLNCSFDATLGSGSIPAAALSQLPAETELHLFSMNRNLVSTPEGNVALTTGMEIASEDRTGYPLFILK